MINNHPISRYLSTQTTTSPSFSADGKQLAFLANITGVMQVWQVPLTGTPDLKWATQLTFGEDRATGAWYSPINPNLLMFARDEGGNENAQLFLLDVNAGISQNLTTKPDTMHIPGGWLPDGSGFLFAANRRHPALFDLHILRLDGTIELMWEQTQAGYIFKMALSPDGKRVTVDRHLSSMQVELWEVDLEGKTGKLLSPPDQQNVFYQPVYHGNHSVLISTDFNADFTYIATVDTKTGQIAPFIEADWDVDAPILSPDKSKMVYRVNEGGKHQLIVKDMVSGVEKGMKMPASSGTLNAFLSSAVSFSPDNTQIAFPFTAPNNPGDIYLYNIAQDTTRPITHVSSGGIPRHLFIEPELIHYPTFDEREIPAWLYKSDESKDEGKMPAIVIVHGGPEGQSQTNFSFTTQYFAHQGYAVLVPNVRGSSGYGKDYMNLDNVRNRMDSVEDLGYAAQWLKAQSDIDGDRLVVYGGSYGGFMVLSTLVTHPELWAAGVNIVGISNFVTFLENTSDYRRAHREAEYGSLAVDRDFLNSISPLTHLDTITAPLFIIHGENDPRVPVSEARQLAKALQERDHPVELLIFDDEGHGIQKLKNKLVMFPKVVAFLDKHV